MSLRCLSIAKMYGMKDYNCSVRLNRTETMKFSFYFSFMLCHGSTIVAYVAGAEINGCAFLEATRERGVTREKMKRDFFPRASSP